MSEFCGFRKSRPTVRTKCVHPFRMRKCFKGCSEPEVALVEPRCISAVQPRTEEVLTHPQEDRIYGIELISPEPFVVKYPNDSPIQAVIPRSVSPVHAGNMRSSSGYRGRQMDAHRSPLSHDYHRSKTPIRRSPSPQSRGVHRSHSADKRSRSIRRGPRTRSFTKYIDDDETVVGNGGRFIYVNPEYVQRYHRFHGNHDSFSSSETAEKNHYRGNNVFEYNDI
ncbi:unnamed protein product [Rodentolepis nana]|uniref:Uncharacterized protein n=1 Tax=Rodentolepis nana TaxID=102285 RepID=A0A0R3TJC7_RODNA|nr:unnamed protein product [Rodentolepis nana]